MQNYNLEADGVIKMCNQKKKDLEVIIQSINYVAKLSAQTDNEWVKCLKKRAKQDPEEVKTSIHDAKKAVKELVEDLIELEKVVTVDECEEWSNYISGQIVDKQYGDCAANAELIENKWNVIKAKVTKASEKYGAEGVLMKAATAEKERLTALNLEEGCTSALSTTIAKDRWVGDKKRKRCIAMDEDNQDVNECYYENIKYPEGQEPGEGEEKKVLVYNDGLVYWCDAPADANEDEEAQQQAEGEEGQYNANDYKLPIINMINPQTCLPGGVSS